MKTLELDFETSPAKGYFWGSIWETNIIHVIEYEQILCVAWKWHGEKKVHVIGQNDFKGYKAGKLNDKELLQFFAPTVAEADIVVAHNGDRFDLTVLNTRLLHHRMKPVPYGKSLDTKKISKNKLHLPSNKLDDIADFLDIGHKTPHTGKDMWFGCENGIKKDWDLMKKYCKQDIALLDKVLDFLTPFMKQTNQYFSINGRINCPNPTCMSENLSKHKLRRCAGGFKQQYQCMDCGAYTTDSKLIKQ